jgi:hypothetical protein
MAPGSKSNVVFQEVDPSLLLTFRTTGYVQLNINGGILFPVLDGFAEAKLTSLVYRLIMVSYWCSMHVFEDIVYCHSHVSITDISIYKDSMTKRRPGSRQPCWRLHSLSLLYKCSSVLLCRLKT